jgi:NADH-quinone oxidoreductase subunit J
MSLILFWFFSLLTLGFACLVVFNRNPVASALSLVVSFLGLAALFTLLDAYFIGIIQVLVYGGAIMVLFLFIIMLLDLRAEKRRKFNLFATIGGGAVMLGFIGQVCAVLRDFPGGNRPFPVLAAPLEDVHNIGTLLFSNYNLPFQVIGVVVLVATIGVVILSKKELR